MGMKYISYDNGRYPTILVFDAVLNHSDMFNLIKNRSTELLGAGKVELDDEGAVYCCGRSITLNIVSRGKEDTELLYRHLKSTA